MQEAITIEHNTISNGKPAKKRIQVNALISSVGFFTLYCAYKSVDLNDHGPMQI